MSESSAVRTVGRFVDECCLVAQNARFPAVSLNQKFDITFPFAACLIGIKELDL